MLSHRPARPEISEDQPPSRAPSRSGRRARVGVVLAGVLALGVAGCGVEGSSSDGGTSTGAGTTASDVVEAATEAERTCTEVPPVPRDELDLSVEEPFDSERYDAGTAALRLEAADGEERCLTLELDGERSRGWDFDANRIDLTFGRADGPTVRLRTSGEPMAGFVDASLEVTDDDGEQSVPLNAPGACALLLAQMAEGQLEAWIDCPAASPGSGGLSAVSGHLTATLG